MRAEPIRVCHLGKYYPPAPGGIETHVRTLAKAQAALGAEVQVLCVNHADARNRDVRWSRYGASGTTEENDAGVRVTRLGRSAHVAKFDIVPGLRAAFQRLKREHVDILHLHAPNPTMLMAVVGLRRWARLVITHHSDIIKQRKLYYVFAPFERVVYEKADCIISNSRPYIDGSERLQRHRAKVETVPMGLDLSPFLFPSRRAQTVQRDLRQRYGNLLWLAVGRCVYYKGFDTAIRALRSVPGTLIIIGQGPYQGGLKELASACGVQERIVWWPYASPDELVGAYHAATAVWFPSNARSEAFGLVQVEAMASGCPVVNTAIPNSGVAWVSRHGQSGLTVPVGNPTELAAAANCLAADAALRDRYARTARGEAANRFSDRPMAARMLAIYRRVLDRAAAPLLSGLRPAAPEMVSFDEELVAQG